ncbi:MAG: c-type cytochrome [Chloroflexi bacterium]|nr:c-type cytochrome [Chloroflexota bacterium]
MRTANGLRMRLLVWGSLLVLVALSFMMASLALAAPLPDVAKGKVAYDKVCAVCHGFEGKGGPIAPPLAKDLIYFKEVGLPVQAATGLIIQATKERPSGAIMPVYNPGKISDAEAADVGDYLWSLSPAPAAVIPPGDAQKGAAPYAANCAVCHGAKGEGVTAPPLAAIVAGLKAGGAPPPIMHALVRLAARSGALPGMPTFAPDKLSDAQLADIAAHIWELPPPAPPPAALPKTGDSTSRYALVIGLLGVAALATGIALQLRRRIA